MLNESLKHHESKIITALDKFKDFTYVLAGLLLISGIIKESPPSLISGTAFLASAIIFHLANRELKNQATTQLIEDNYQSSNNHIIY